MPIFSIQLRYANRHVLAAAIRGRADIIVTFNIKDFPEAELSNYGSLLRICRRLWGGTPNNDSQL